MSFGLMSWLAVDGVEFLKKLGLERGDVVLDFGCGSGIYSIPAAILVGKHGVVYSIDKRRRVLDELMVRASSLALYNIKTIVSSDEAEIPLKEDSVDLVLLYDIFRYFPVGNSRLVGLLFEVRRVLKQEGLLSVFPKHVDIESLVNSIVNCSFYFLDEYSGMLVHNGKLESGRVLNFRISSDGD